LTSLPDGYQALVIGGSGAIGAAFAAQLQADPRCGRVLALHRHSQPAVDYDRADNLAAAAEALRSQAPWHLVIVATGMLHGAAVAPEKRLAELKLAALETVFRTNTFGPALLLGLVAPLLDRQRSLLGGWYAYRASKAALNMIVKTASIELQRTHPGAVLVALHPGTVRSGLSRPFRGDQIGRDPAQAAAQMLQALDALGPDDSGSFVAYDGQRLPW
jgi:NAD(P)-dependent dehydrogenase (short-subunit alcohol dehydrogenase family)